MLVIPAAISVLFKNTELPQVDAFAAETPTGRIFAIQGVQRFKDADYSA
jgi:hypothetical protein